MKGIEAVAAAQAQTAEAKKRGNQKQLNRPLTTSGILKVFRATADEIGIGTGLLTQKEVDMARGFKKICMRNGMEGFEVYPMLERVVREWSTLRHRKIRDTKGKEVLLPVRPSLSSFLSCRESILREIRLTPESKIQATVPVAPKQEAPIPVRAPRKFKPTQEDLDREFANVADDDF